MNPVPVVVLSEVHEFSLKVLSILKEDVIKELTTNDSEDTRNEGMRAGRIESSPNNLQSRLHQLIQ